MSKRIYVVNGPGEQKHLVRATNKNAAIRHLADQHFTAEVADQEELLRLVQKSVAVEEAGEATT